MPKGSVVEWSYVVPNLNAVGFLLFCCLFGRGRLFYCVFNNVVGIRVITHCANFRISNVKVMKYRVIQEESAILWEMIVCVILSKKFIWTWVRFWTVTELWAFINFRTRPRVNRVLRNQLAGDVLNLVAYRLRWKHYVCHVTRAVHNRAAACFAAGGGIFENQL